MKAIKLRGTELYVAYHYNDSEIIVSSRLKLIDNQSISTVKGNLDKMGLLWDEYEFVEAKKPFNPQDKKIEVKTKKVDNKSK